MTWRHSHATGGRVPGKIQVSVHAINGIFPAVTRRFTANPHPQTSAVLELPAVDGPYEIVAKTLWKDGTLSAETTATVEG